MQPYQPYQPVQPYQPAPPRMGRRRRRGGWFRLLVVLAIVLFTVFVALDPWAVHIGGRFTPLETWDGYGPLQASNGGRYLLFAHLNATVYDRHGGRSCSLTGCDNLHGSAQLCTENGHTYAFALTGAVHSWWSTDGARTGVDLTGGSPVSLPDGWVIAFHGAWQGQALPLADTDNSFTEVFTPAGQIRHVTSTADAGTARVTIRPGTAAAFASACRQLAAGPRQPAG